VDNLHGITSGPGISIVPVALGIGAVVFLGLAALVGVFVIVVVANRGDTDPSGQRPLSVYLFGVSFVSVFAALFAGFGIVLGLVQLIGSHGASVGRISTYSPNGTFMPNGSLPSVLSSPVSHPVGDAVARVVTLAGLVVLVAAALLATHLRRGLALPEWRAGRGGPVSRVVRSYVAAVSFVAVLIAAVSVVVVVYQVFRILGPGVFALSGSRVEAARVLIAALYLVAAAAVLVVSHMRLLPDGLFARPAGSDAAPPAGAAPPPPATP
jgi:hypothetical protein